MALSDIGATKRSANAIDVNQCVILTDNRSTRLQKERNKLQIKEFGRVHTAVKGYFSSKLQKFVVTSGRTRVMNLLELLSEGIDVSPIIPIESVAAPKTPEDEAKFLLQEITDNDSEEFLPIDCARVAQQLKEQYLWGNAEIARQLGRSEADIGQLLRLLELPVGVQDMIADNQISATLATQIIQKHKNNASGVISEIVEDAQKDGKKATAKHLKKLEEKTVKEVKPSRAKILEEVTRKLFDSIEVLDENEEADTVDVQLSKSQLDELLALLR